MRVRLGATALACALTALAPPTAQASETASQSFAGAGEHVFIVPSGVTSVSVQLVGARGGQVSVPPNPQGGSGADVEAGLAVVPGQILYVEIGGQGAEGTNAEVGPAEGGSNGGGAGAYGEFPAHAKGAGGGGATDVRTCSVNPLTPGQPAACAAAPTLASRLVVAGGGGGAGGPSAAHGSGGAGGAAGSEGSNGAMDNVPGGGGGHVGGLAAGGAGGVNSEEREGIHSREEFPAQTGKIGVGGLGGGYKEGGGGGGGGGVYGGGGGGGGDWEVEGPFERYGGGGGGGGGASGRPLGVSGVSVTNVTTASPGAAPAATLTWTLPPPGAVTGPAQAVTATSALLTGAVNPDGSAVSGCYFTISPAPGSGSTVPCTQQVGAGGSPVSVTASVSDLTPATAYTITLLATNTQGNATGQPVTFSTAAGTGPGGPGGGAGGPSALAGASPPVIAGPTLSRTRFRRGRKVARIAVARTAPTGTTITFTLSAAARVTLQFQLPHPGVLVAGRCARPSHAIAGRHRCTRYVALSRTLVLAGHAGSDRVSFDGVLAAGARMTPGTYRLSLTAADAAGSATAPAHPTFTLLGP